MVVFTKAREKLMRIIADHKIPLLEETFGRFGEVRRLASTDLKPSAIKNADALLVRSETRVDADLLQSARVRFVGSPTIGVDHIDLPFLRRAEIGFSNAPGCNARSVVEYVLTALCNLAHSQGESLIGRTLGVVGVGNIGSRLARDATRLGLRVLLNDPPRQREEGGTKFLAIEDLLDCDFLSLHVPLTRGSQDPTHHLFDQDQIGRMKARATLINTSRGAVVDNRALTRALESHQIARAVLDVWEGEPQPQVDLIRLATIATPHIAGYSSDGKLRGTWMVFQQFCRHFELDAESIELPQLSPPRTPVIAAGSLGPGAGASAEWCIQDAIQRAYPILRDDARLRETLAVEESARAHYFRSLRANYPPRREFAAFQLGAEFPSRARQLLTSLGFKDSGSSGSERA